MAKVLSIITAFSPVGGTAAKLRALMKESEHEHHLYHPANDSDRILISQEMPYYESIGVKAFYGIHNRNIVAHAKQVCEIIDQYNIDIVHFYFNFEQCIAPFIKSKFPHVKMVRSIVGFEKPLVWWKNLIIKRAFKTVDNYIFISHYIEKMYTDMYPTLKGRNTKLIYNGAVNVKELTIPCEDKKTIVSIGGLCERKNMLVLVEAMNLIKNKYRRDDIELNIIGDGPNREQIENLIRQYYLQGNVNLIGYTDKVADYLNDCAIYVHPATTEGFGIAVVEAMQMHCACIVSDKGALPELVVNGKNGFVVDAYDPEAWASKILFLYDNKESRLSFGEESYSRAVNMFSLNSFVRNHDDFYNSLIS